MGGDTPRTHQGLGLRGVHLQVIDHALVDHLRLRHGHSRDPISPGDLAARGDRALASDADLEHLQPNKSLLPPLLGRRPTEEDVIDDDSSAGTNHCGDPVHPRRFQRPELRPDTHPAIRGELDPRIRCLHGRGHRLDQRIDPDGKPWIRQDRL
jgi:hypothetical protein